jgi:hypothetical protein
MFWYWYIFNAIVLLYNTVYPRNPAKLNTRIILLHFVFGHQNIYNLCTTPKHDVAFCGPIMTSWISDLARCLFSGFAGLLYRTALIPVWIILHQSETQTLNGGKIHELLIWNGFGRKRSWPNRYTTQHATWDTEESHENLHLNWWKPRKTTSIYPMKLPYFEPGLPEIQFHVVTSTPHCWVKIATCRASNPTTLRHKPRNDR